MPTLGPNSLFTIKLYRSHFNCLQCVQIFDVDIAILRLISFAIMNVFFYKVQCSMNLNEKHPLTLKTLVINRQKECVKIAAANHIRMRNSLYLSLYVSKDGVPTQTSAQYEYNRIQNLFNLRTSFYHLYFSTMYILCM